MFFRKRLDLAAGDGKTLIPPQERDDQIRKSLTLIVQALIAFIKEFSMDIKEIDSAGFKSEMDRMLQYFETAVDGKKTLSYFERQKNRISQYSDHLKKYIEEREKELWGIIELLTHAVTNLTTDNQIFYNELSNQSENLDDIARLDDIKKIKTALKEEIDKINFSVKTKKDREKQQIERLSSQVETLKVQLEKVREESERDGLTGIYNRQSFDSKMNDVIGRRFISKQAVSLLMMDIDNFKSINDTFGHTVGDRVLVAFSKKCEECIRKDDFLARYGGEEFALVLEGSTLKNAAKKAQQICEVIASKRYAIEGYPERPLVITASIGVSTLRKEDTVESFINRADRALYIAKQNGKNRAITEKLVQ